MSDTPESKPTTTDVINNIPYWIKGTIDNVGITIPFLTAGDVDTYLDMLLRATRKMGCSVNVKIFAEGKEVGALDSATTKH